MDTKFITLNVNGISTERKQKLLFDFLKMNNIKIICLQEHNIKDKGKLMDMFYDNFDVVLNESINLKGGTAVLIDKSLGCKILQIEKSPCSRITSVKLVIGEKRMHILNVYAPSGSKFHQVREQMFRDEIIYYLRNNLSNTILCGDFNCILNKRDKSKNSTCPLSKNLSSTITNLNLKDVWSLMRNDIEYTYFRDNYGSRLDRIYATDLASSISNIITKPIPFSDHHGVIIDISLNTSIEMGRFYWKLNVRLLEDQDIGEEFKVLWDKMITRKIYYDNVNEWWEKHAKVNICKFFKRKGREESKLQKGLLKYFELKLNKLYREFHNNGQLDLTETKRLKSKINDIKEKIMEGVSIRARIKEQTEGERPSSSLLSKQSSSKAKTKISEIKTEYYDDTSTNTVLNSQVSIMNYITESFQNQYEDVAIDKNKQDWFLSFIEKCVSENDNKSLISFISDEEIYLTIKSFNNNKSPGIDGLPIEFYINFFHIIRTEFCEMIRNSFRIKKLTDSQRKAIIILLFKGGDCKLLSSRRPISLICVDTKIMSKIIANRLKPIMKCCISNEQFCGSEKSIIECNNVTRDMLYYINEQNITCALINIDLQKAFDSVNHSFLFSVMRKMGFSLEFISFIQMFYNEVISVCLVNGHQGNSFNIKRGVRQGCPLSMLLYVLAQEPLYRALKASTQIQAIDIPCKETKLLGFADDTSIFVNSILSITSVFNILKDYGNASGIQVNNKKTKIMGFGGWMDRTEWPISDLKTQSSDITILGIIFCRDINVAINLTWDKILSNIRIMTRLLSGRHFTLHQRAIIVNTLIL